MNFTAIARINLSALTHNLSIIHELMPKQKMLAMVKSNAYGHGLVPIVRAMKTADAFGVASIAEALQAREAVIDRDFVVMRGFSTEDELSIFFNNPHLIACIHAPEQVLMLERQKITDHRVLRIWLKVDTGMNRLGVPCELFQSVYQRLSALPFIDKQFVVCSHLADADNQDTAFTEKQIAGFNQVTANIVNEKSLLNSAGIVAHANAHYDWIRPGLMMYGISPFAQHGPHDVIMQRFRPVMTLESKIIAVKKVNAGEKIGYSCTFTAKNPMKIAIVGMGYGDSYPRNVKNGTPVLIRNTRCSIVGRVSMDMITVDVTHLDHVKIDDTVILWDDRLLVSEIAQCVNTVPHELVCHLTGRVRMVYE